ncbi:MAG: HipA N-terminal domain-containing protein [Deltaproteobacteria bacterium]|nr:HipA N-terminal domain-containing protein [Deltaproteobacteria bacterium]
MADEPLDVFYGTRLVGRISPDPLTFAYERGWLSLKDAFPLSVALPLERRSFDEGEVRAFFFNLLPEGNVRRRLAGRLKISEGNDYMCSAEVAIP